MTETFVEADKKMAEAFFVKKHIYLTSGELI